MKTTCQITGNIQKDVKGNIFCQEVLLPYALGYYVGYKCTITEIENNLKVEEMPEYPYFCSCPSSIDVQIPVTVTVSEEGRLLGGKYLISDRQEIAEGTNITIKKIRPIIEKGSAFWGTILQYDKVEEKAQEKSNIPSIEDFQYLLDAGYKNIFAALEPAMKYYQSDPMQSCMNFRSVLKLTVVEAEGITHCTTKGGLYAKLKNLCSFLSERNLLDSAMNKELWVVKTTSDPYHHPEDHPDLNPKKDRYTFYCAFQEIFKWLIALPEAFAAFIRARDEKQARIEAEREMRAQEAKERAEAERKALEEHKKQEEADRKRLERNARVFLTLLTFHLLMSPLKADFPNNPLISVMLETSMSLRSALSPSLSIRSSMSALSSSLS